MPWCEPCERYLTPNTVTPDGSCPTCGGAVDAGPASPSAASVSTTIDDRRASEPVPWHFWVLLLLAVVYLGWRAIEGVALLL